MARSLAAKAALATRLDAFGEDIGYELGVEHKAKLETRLHLLEEGNLRRLSGTGKAKAKLEKYHVKTEVLSYPSEADSTLPTTSGKGKKRKLIEVISEEPAEVKEEPQDDGEKKKKKKKKNKDADESVVEETSVVEEPSKKKKKAKIEQAEETEMDVTVEPEEGEPSSEKKKKKKKKKNKTDDE